MSMQDNKLSFLLKSIYNVLPTPTNLCIWGMIEEPVCTLCRGQANLEHILLACKTALADRRYTWRHDKSTGCACGWDRAGKEEKARSEERGDIHQLHTKGRDSNRQHRRWRDSVISIRLADASRHKKKNNIPTGDCSDSTETGHCTVVNFN